MLVSPPRNKNIKDMTKILSKNNFYCKGLIDFELSPITGWIRFNDAFELFIKAVKSLELKCETLTKVILIVFSLIQQGSMVQNNPEFRPFISYLSESIRSKINKKSETKKGWSLSSASQSLLSKFENMISLSKSTQDHSSKQFTCCKSFEQYLAQNTLEPLLSLLQKIEMNYEEIYNNKIQVTQDLCWATLNILHKYTGFYKGFEVLGRYYYTESVRIVYQIFKILDEDIKRFSGKVESYLLENIQKYNQMWTREGYNNLKQNFRQVKDLVMISQELVSVTDKIHLLYNNRYFSMRFMKCGIHAPKLYREAQTIVPLLLQFVQNEQKIQSKTSLSKTTMPRIENQNFEDVPDAKSKFQELPKYKTSCTLSSQKDNLSLRKNSSIMEVLKMEQFSELKCDMQSPKSDKAENQEVVFGDS